MNRTTSAPELLVRLARGAGPLRAQLEGQLREGVATGRLGAGTRLPSSRALAASLGVSRGVVVEAYAQLVAEGYLTVRRGAAPVVAPSARARPAASGERRPAAGAVPRFDLRPGTPDLALFPRRAWAAALRRALQVAADADLGYPDPAGHPRLRAALAAYLGRVRGVDAAPERIVVCGGVSEVMALLARVLCQQGASRIGVEDPSHDETRALLAHHGLQPVPIPVDGDGIDVGALAAAAPDAVLVTPAHQFPAGAVLAPARRAALVAWARRTGGLVIEDDYDAEYRYDRQPVGAVQGLAPEQVVHAHSVSKTLAPGLRLGWAVLPARLAGVVAQEKWRADLGAPVLEQIALAEFLARGELDRHLRHTRPLYRRRRDVLLHGLPAEGAAAGLHALAGLGERAEADVVARAAALDVAVVPLGQYTIHPRPPALVLGFSRLPEPTLAEAAQRLRSALG